MPARLLPLLAKSLAANLLPQELFRTDIAESRVRQLVQRFVRVVEIENHSYCNRVCSFCPNAFLDRRSEKHPLAHEIFARILADLTSIDYNQTLVWSRYHEPFADDSIIPAIAEARQALPHAWLVAVSNGDYVDADLLRRAQEAGLDRLMLDLYMPEGKERDLQTTGRELGKFLARTGLHAGDRLGPWDYRLTGSHIDITLGIPKYEPQNLSSRGGLIAVPGHENYQRKSVCFNPLHSLIIDYNGAGMLCCQVRSDAPQHADAIYADLGDPQQNLFTLYRSLAPARKALLSPGTKSGVCTSCSMGDNGPDRLARRVPLRWLGALPGVEPLLGHWPRKRPYES